MPNQTILLTDEFDQRQENNAESISESSRFTMILNDAIRDPRLSWRAKGILAGCLSHSAGFRFNKAWILSHGTEGRDAINAALASLRELGYLENRIERCPETGRITGERLIFRDRPIRQSGSECEDRRTGNPAAGKPGDRETRHPEKPASGKPGDIRRPILQEDQLEEDQYKYIAQSPKPKEKPKSRRKTLQEKVDDAILSIPCEYQEHKELLTQWLVGRKEKHKADPEFTTRSIKAMKDAKEIGVLKSFLEIAAERKWLSLGFTNYPDTLESLAKERRKAFGNNPQTPLPLIKPKATLG